MQRRIHLTKQEVKADVLAAKDLKPPKPMRVYPSADESALLAEVRNNPLRRISGETGDDLYALTHAYERLLKLDKKP